MVGQASPAGSAREPGLAARPYRGLRRGSHRQGAPRVNHSHPTGEGGSAAVLALQIRKRRLRELQPPSQSHIASKGQSWASDPQPLASEV